jgi:ParB-like chromosome segregation protein Spo0J
MAVQWDVKSSCTQEWRFFPEDIVVKAALNGRHVLPDITALAQDIATNGQHTPVQIRKDGGKPVLLAGFSRWRAVSEINKGRPASERIPLRCTYVQCSEEEGFLTAISENRIRNQTTELDDAYNIKRLMKQYAKTEEQVAQIYFPGAAGDELKAAIRWVRKREALVNLSPEAEQAMKDGRLKGSAAVAIAKLSQDQQKAAISKAPANGKISAPKKSKPNISMLATSIFHGADIEKAKDSDAKFWEVDRIRLLKLWDALHAEG